MMGTRSTHQRPIPVSVRVASRLRLLVGLGMLIFAAPAVSPALQAAPPPAAQTPQPLFGELLTQAPGLHPEALRLALKASDTAAQKGLVRRRDLLTVIDYSLPSTQPRLFVFDLAQRKLLFRDLVAHGKNSGDNLTTRFSNSPGSLETSLGLFVTADTYIGNNGYSLRLQGLERGFNDLALSRAIVMHGAEYVSGATAKMLGRIGRSWGCPALPKAVAKKVIDTVKGGTPVFAYYPDPNWLAESAFLK